MVFRYFRGREKRKRENCFQERKDAYPINTTKIGTGRKYRSSGFQEA